ncbi:hypothetical protein [Spirosoma luteolum]
METKLIDYKALKSVLIFSTSYALYKYNVPISRTVIGFFPIHPSDVLTSFLVEWAIVITSIFLIGHIFKSYLLFFCIGLSAFLFNLSVQCGTSIAFAILPLLVIYFTGLLKK